MDTAACPVSRPQSDPQHHRNRSHGRAAGDAVGVGLDSLAFRLLVAPSAAGGTRRWLSRAAILDPARLW